MSLPTIEQVRKHLRLDEDIEDAGADTNTDLQLLLDAAVDHASQILNRPIPWKDAQGNDVDVPASVVQAILLLIGDFYENREAVITGTIVAENPTVMRLLHFYRKGLGV